MKHNPLKVACLGASCLPAVIALILTGPLWASAQSEPQPDSPSTPAIAPDFATSRKQADKSLAALGEQITYTILLTNTGNDKAVSVVAVDTLPDGVLADVPGVSASAGSVTGTPNLITWTGGLLTGTGAIITIPVIISTCEPNLVNSVYISDPGLQTVSVVTASSAEGFERYASLPLEWGQTDVVGPLADWTQTALGKHPAISPHSGSGMARFNSFEVAAGLAARLYTRLLDFPGGYEPRLSFWVYHDPAYPTQGDSIQPQISVDGGATYTSVGSLVLRHSPIEGWQQHVVSLAGYAGQSNVRLGFLGTSGFGNDIYLDDIQMLYPPGNVNVTVQPSLVRVAGQPVTFTSEVNAEAAHWRRYWDFGDGAPIEVSNTLTRVYTVAGDFTATLQICGVNVYEQALTVLAAREVSLASVGEHLLGQSAYFTATPIVGSLPVTYVWAFGDGFVTQSGHVISHTFATAGVYTPVVTITNGFDWITATTSVRVMNGLAVLESSGDHLLGAAAYFTATADTGSAPVTYTWNLGDGVVVLADRWLSYTYSAAGNYTVVVSVTTGFETITATTSVHVLPVSDVSVTVGLAHGTHVRVGRPYTLSAQIRNEGPSPVASATLRSWTTPSDALAVTADGSVGNCAANGAQVNCSGIAIGVSGTAYISIRVTPGTVAVYTTTFELLADEYDPDSTGHTAEITAEVQLSQIFLPSAINRSPFVPDVPVLNPIVNAPTYEDVYAVTWTLVPGSVTYVLQQATNAAFTMAITAYVGTGTSRNITDAAPGAYYYRVKAVSALGNLGWSNVQSVEVKLPGVPGLQPIAAPPAGVGAYGVTWSQGQRAAYYFLQESTNDLFAVDAVTYTLAMTSWQVLDKSPGIYYYRVRSVNRVGQSAWSATRSVLVRSNPYNGLWSGTTSQGRLVQFEISNGLLIRIRFGYAVQSCSGEINYILQPSLPVSGSSFSLSRLESAREYVFSGAFSAASQATGQVLLTLYDSACNQQTRITWSASKIAP